MIWSAWLAFLSLLNGRSYDYKKLFQQVHQSFVTLLSRELFVQLDSCNSLSVGQFSYKNRFIPLMFYSLLKEKIVRKFSFNMMLTIQKYSFLKRSGSNQPCTQEVWKETNFFDVKLLAVRL